MKSKLALTIASIMLLTGCSTSGTSTEVEPNQEPTKSASEVMADIVILQFKMEYEECLLKTDATPEYRWEDLNHDSVSAIYVTVGDLKIDYHAIMGDLGYSFSPQGDSNYELSKGLGCE
jgi:hypothetical protein